MSSDVNRDLLEELCEENKRLFSELLFAEECLKVLTEFKSFVDLISVKFIDHLESEVWNRFEQLSENANQVLSRKLDISGCLESSVHFKKQTEDTIDFNDNRLEDMVIEEMDNEEEGVKSPELLSSDDEDITTEEVRQRADTITNAIIRTQTKTIDTEEVDKKDNQMEITDETPKNIEENVSEDESSADLIECLFSDCDKTFKMSYDYLKHLKTHSMVKKFICQKCNKSFDSNTQLSAHTESDHPLLPILTPKPISKPAITRNSPPIPMPPLIPTPKTKTNGLKGKTKTNDNRLSSLVQEVLRQSSDRILTQRSYTSDKMTEVVIQSDPKLKTNKSMPKSKKSSKELKSNERNAIKNTEKCNEIEDIIEDFNQSLEESPEIIDLSDDEWTPEDKTSENTGPSDDEIECLFDNCNQSFKTSTDYLDHLKSHSKPKKIICEKCNKRFDSDAQLSAHTKSDHQLMPNPRPTPIFAITSTAVSTPINSTSQPITISTLTPTLVSTQNPVIPTPTLTSAPIPTLIPNYVPMIQMPQISTINTIPTQPVLSLSAPNSYLPFIQLQPNTTLGNIRIQPKVTQPVPLPVPLSSSVTTSAPQVSNKNAWDLAKAMSSFILTNKVDPKNQNEIDLLMKTNPDIRNMCQNLKLNTPSVNLLVTPLTTPLANPSVNSSVKHLNNPSIRQAAKTYSTPSAGSSVKQLTKGSVKIAAKPSLITTNSSTNQSTISSAKQSANSSVKPLTNNLVTSNTNTSAKHKTRSSARLSVNSSTNNVSAEPPPQTNPSVRVTTKLKTKSSVIRSPAKPLVKIMAKPLQPIVTTNSNYNTTPGHSILRCTALSAGYPMKCLFFGCGQSFRTRDNYQNHMRSHSGITANFVCGKCKDGFDTLELLNAHTRQCTAKHGLDIEPSAQTHSKKPRLDSEIVSVDLTEEDISEQLIERPVKDKTQTSQQSRVDSPNLLSKELTESQLKNLFHIPFQRQELDTNEDIDGSDSDESFDCFDFL